MLAHVAVDGADCRALDLDHSHGRDRRRKKGGHETRKDILPDMGDNSPVKALLNARAALLQALCEGPGHGSALAQRVRDRSLQQIRLGHGGVYAALSQLQRAGLVHGWVVAPGRRRGARSRHTYELTPKGIEVAERQRLALRAVAGVADRPDPVEMVAMRQRLREASDLSAAVLSLRDAMPE